MSCEFGNRLKIEIFGQSHSPAIGVVMDGLPAGITLDLEEIRRFLERRAPGRHTYSTPRREADSFEILSGVNERNLTCGAPLCAVIRNTNTRSADYTAVRNVPRPSHSDFSAYMKYGRAHDLRGGGNFSGRMTAPLCFAGAVAMQLLQNQGIVVGAHITSVYTAADRSFDPVNVSRAELLALRQKDFPVLDDAAGEKMITEIEMARAQGDSLGGTIECAVLGLPAGVGEPIFNGVENQISAAVFGIPAVRGIEFGAGFASSAMKGTEHNDPFCISGGEVRTRTNRHGGVLGGITTGMPLVFKAAVKPTPSIGTTQQSVDLESMKETELTIVGRHDPCIVPRAVPCVEAAAAIALLDLLLMNENGMNERNRENGCCCGKD